ncbi:MAG: flavodoxin-dependent (E)-4-hydroxy-3-methylbut-2-enyl-diphosphate synthase, partial [Bacteroidales bacterium]|nr:flavodoxin-dependent (E)-4-hydroxy-3-methylbut-2-enyl-diphosphate synthase [Bacteroidales bacterium]
IDGIGDTIRVSLSEDPELEIPVAKQMVRLIQERSEGAAISGKVFPKYDPFSFQRRETVAVGSFGGGQVPAVIADCRYSDLDFGRSALKPDYVFSGLHLRKRADGIPQLCDASIYEGQKDAYPVFSLTHISELEASTASVKFLQLGFEDLSESLAQRLSQMSNVVLLLYSQHVNRVAEQRAAFHFLLNHACRIPVVIVQSSLAISQEEEQVVAGLDFGPLLLDGFGDGLMVLASTDDSHFRNSPENLVSILFGVLQASRLRMSKTEYISCPGCGRTLYDLQKVIAKIKAGTSHLKGLKIGIMGCIVNGPGEMADADYGYVGAGRGQVSLYKGQECVERSIPEEEAIDKLIELIRLNGDWKEPDVS